MKSESAKLRSAIPVERIAARKECRAQGCPPRDAYGPTNYSIFVISGGFLFLPSAPVEPVELVQLSAQKLCIIGQFRDVSPPFWIRSPSSSFMFQRIEHTSLYFFQRKRGDLF